MGIRKIWPTGWRAIVLLIVGSVMGANLVAPAVAHIGTTVDHLWKQHIRPLADKRYQKIPTTTQRLTIAGSTFVDADGLNRSDPFVESYCTKVGTSGDFYAPVHLPQGVTVTGYRVDYQDDSTTTGYNGDVWLTRFPLKDQGGSYDDLFLAELNNTATPGEYVKATGAIFTPGTQKIDNTRYAYSVIGQMGANPAVCNTDLLDKVPKPFAATAPAVGTPVEGRKGPAPS